MWVWWGGGDMYESVNKMIYVAKVALGNIKKLVPCGLIDHNCLKYCETANTYSTL